MKILAFLRHYPPPSDGGAYNYNSHVVEQLCASGANVTVITHKDAPRVISPSLTVIPLRSIKIGRFHYTTRAQQIFDIIASILNLRILLLKKKFDWIITDAGYIQNLIVFLGTFLTTYRIIGISHSEEITIIQKTTNIRARLQRWLLKKHTCNIVNAKRTGKILKKIGVKSEILLIYPCVENLPALNKVIERKKLIQIYSIKESDLIIGFLGRHVQRKGMRNLILAVQDLRRSGYEISLLIAGQGPESDNIQNFIRENDCQAFCMMIGLLPEEEKASFLCGIDVFSMPNISDPKTGDSEGFGIVFLEAAQQGTAVIGGKDGGVPEAISDEFNGLIVDGQSYTSIKMAIKKYYQNPSLRLAHGENGKLWAKKFDWQDQVKPLVQFLVKN